jgi:hypothetical protein
MSPRVSRQRVSACTDLAQLETWFSGALHAGTVKEVFDDGHRTDSYIHATTT